MLKVRVAFLTVVLVILLVNLSVPVAPSHAQANRLSVIGSTTMIADVVGRVAGDAADVTALMGYGIDPHSYEPSAQDIVALDEADLVFINGANFEEGLLPVLEEAATDNLITISDCIAVLPFGATHSHEDAEGDEHDHAEGEEHDHAETTDEHDHDGETSTIAELCEAHFAALEALGVEIEHGHEHVQATDSSPWTGEWISNWAFGTEAMQAGFDAVLNVTPELTLEDILAYYEERYITSFDTFAVDGQNITFVSGDTSQTCVYTFVGTEPILQNPNENWALFETGDQACSNYKYVLLSPPHSPEAGGSRHFHIRYGTTSFQEIINDDSLWFPFIYPIGTEAETLVGSWTTSPRQVGLRIGEALGKDIALTDEEIAETADGEEAAHEHEHAEAHTESLGLLYEAGCEAGDEHDEEEAEGGEHVHEHGSCDPHLWTDIRNVMLWTLKARDVLSEADPANATVYAANADAYLAELIALDSEVTALLASIPEENRILITNHETLGYLAARYGFEVVGTIIPGGGTSNEPSAEDVAALIETIQDYGVPAIFSENTVSTALAEQIAAETGAEVYQLYSDSLTDADGPAHTYIDYMRTNATIIVTALNPQ